MSKIKSYLSFVKFAHSVFALPFALTGYFMALNINHIPFDPLLLVYVILAMVFARNAAMGFNRYVDRHIDKKNPRTQQREIPSGVIKARSALAFVVINALLFVGVTWLINRLAFFLSPVALAVVLGYSLTKRFTALCHLVLGLGLALSPVGAYIAVTGSFNHWAPVLLSFAVLFWTGGFDIIYALQDDEFDHQNNLFSIPAALGRKKALRLSRWLHLLSAVLVVVPGFLMEVSWLYFAGAGIFILLLVNQHRLVKIDDLSKVNLAFFTMNGIASVIFGMFAIFGFYF